MIHPVVIESAGGEYMDTVVVVEWKVKPGDRVSAGDIVVVVETAKATSDVEAGNDGYLREILFQAGEEAPVGARLATISDTCDEIDDGSSAPAVADAARMETDRPESSGRGAARSRGSSARIVATPLARRIAQQQEIDLSRISGSGPNGRIRRRDVEAFVAAGEKASGQGARPSMRAHAASMAPDEGKTSRSTIVLLHGFASDRTAWRQVMPLLDSCHKVLALDLPAHGRRADVQCSDLHAMAAIVSDELQAEGIEEAHLVGHSLGGAVALALTETGPLSVRSLCLISPAGLGPEINGTFLDGLAAAVSAEALLPWLEMMVADPGTLPRGFAGAFMRNRDRTNEKAAQSLLAEHLFPDGTQVTRLTDALKAVKVPTKLIWGTRDAIIPSRHAFEAPGQVGLHLLSNVGHVPPMEAPALVARLITELVRSNS